MTDAPRESYPGSSGLLPCPFCGGSNIKALSHLDWVACDDCGASLEDCEPSARDLWNKRAPQPVSIAQAPLPPLADRDELIALLEDLASVNLSREACARQARRMADDLIARGLALSSTARATPAECK